VGYISSLFYFHFCNFLGSFTFIGGWGGGWGVGNFYLKNHFLLLTFLIVCKFFVIFFHFQRRKGGGTGLRSINVICIY
jgi:hypothetical protein